MRRELSCSALQPCQPASSPPRQQRPDGRPIARAEIDTTIVALWVKVNPGGHSVAVPVGFGKASFLLAGDLEGKTLFVSVREVLTRLASKRPDSWIDELRPAAFAK